MKEQLNRENIEALSAYRFLRAKETLKEIPYLKQQGYYNTAPAAESATVGSAAAG